MAYLARLGAALLFGLVIGCYLNTLEYRLRSDVKLFDSDCYCTSCGARLRLRDQLPVISYLRLGGRCRSCGAKIGLRYPLVEAGSALVYLIFAILISDVIGYAVTTTLAGIAFVTISNALRGSLAFTNKLVAGMLSLIGLNLIVTLGMSVIALAEAAN